MPNSDKLCCICASWIRPDCLAEYEGKPAHELCRQMRAAVAEYEALSPVDKALADSDQRRSYVKGETGCDPGDALADEVRRLRSLVSAARPDYHDSLIEECAKVCDDLADDPYFRVGTVMQEAAKRIRAIQFNAPASATRLCLREWAELPTCGCPEAKCKRPRGALRDDGSAAPPGE